MLSFDLKFKIKAARYLNKTVACVRGRLQQRALCTAGHQLLFDFGTWRVHRQEYVRGLGNT